MKMAAHDELEALEPAAPNLVFEFGGLCVRIPAEHVAPLLDRALLGRHTVGWGQTYHVHDDASRARAVDWLVDELRQLAEVAAQAALSAAEADGPSVYVGKVA